MGNDDGADTPCLASLGAMSEQARVPSPEEGRPTVGATAWARRLHSGEWGTMAVRTLRAWHRWAQCPSKHGCLALKRDDRRSDWARRLHSGEWGTMTVRTLRAWHRWAERATRNGS